MFLELDRRGAEVAYVRTAKGFEVDFHARHLEGREELIQVCISVDQPKIFSREIRALQDAAPDFPRVLMIALMRPPCDRIKGATKNQTGLGLFLLTGVLSLFF